MTRSLFLILSLISLLNCNAPLTESEAKILATKLANKEAKEVKLSYGDDELIPPDRIPTSNWISVYKKNDKWYLNIAPPSGVSTYVEFDLNGSNPKVEFMYSPD